MKTVVLLFLSSVLLFSFGCSNNSDLPQENNDAPDLGKEFIPQTLTPITIAQGCLYGGGREGIAKQDLVITSQSEWDNLKNRMNNVSDNFTETEIDFTKYIVLAVFDEIKGNGGWSIDITDITEFADSILVTVDNLKTGNETRVITQPFHIVKISAASKKIVFRHQLIEDKYDLKNNLMGEWVEISPCDHCHTVSFLENDTVSEKWTMDEIIYTSSYRIIADDSIQIVRHWETNPDKKITNNKIIFCSNDSILIEKFTSRDAAVFPPEFIDIKLSKTKKP
jgi:hypothetical protein